MEGFSFTCVAGCTNCCQQEGYVYITEADLKRDYRTRVDPRLNYAQAMEMAFLLARLMRQNGR